MGLFAAYILLFFVAIIASSLFCIGLYKASDGEHEVAPNGEERKVWGMVLYPIKRFIQGRKVELVYYNAATIDELISSLKILFPENNLAITKNKNKFYAVDVDEWRKCGNALLKEHFIHVKIVNQTRLEIWKEYVSYNWFAYPIIMCYKCYVSFWGSLLYWTFTWVASYLGFIYFDYRISMILWPIFVLSLLPINILLFKLTEEK